MQANTKFPVQETLLEDRVKDCLGIGDDPFNGRWTGAAGYQLMEYNHGKLIM